MSDHLPECLMNLEYAVRVCICPELRACEQRVTERHNAEHKDDRLAAFQNGYDAATVKERQRSVLLIADAYGKGLSAARDAVKDTPCPEGYEAKGCSHWDQALAAIDALRANADTSTDDGARRVPMQNLPKETP